MLNKNNILIKNNKILFLSIPLREHANPSIALAETLISRGHNCTFGIHKSGMHWPGEIAGLKVIEDKTQSLLDPGCWSKVSRLTGKNPGFKGEKLMAKLMLPLVQEESYASIISIIEELKPDLIIAEKTMIPAMDLAVKFNIPYIEVSDLISFRAPLLPHLPALSSSRPKFLTFWERFGNYYDLITLFLAYYPFGVLGQIIRMRRKFKIPKIGHHPIKASLSICTSTFGLELPRPIPPNVLLVGPIFRHTEALNETIQHWLDHSEKPVIYISMGP